jgi:hypothetical protein
MMITDNQSWLNIHAYVVNKWQQVSIVVLLVKVDRTTSNKFTTTLVDNLVKFKGLNGINLA